MALCSLCALPEFIIIVNDKYLSGFFIFLLQNKSKAMKRFLLFLICLALINLTKAQDLYKGNGTASFVSEAPLEIIKGQTDKLAGIVDTSNMNFAFKVNMASFEGFNSALQKEHFNEHYLETKTFPDATFLGTLLIEDDCSNGCDTTAVCKGKFTIHGVTQIVTIPVDLNIDGNTLKISGDFKIKLSDYNIKIPRIVQAKIATEINVTVAVVMQNDR